MIRMIALIIVVVFAVSSTFATDAHSFTAENLGSFDQSGNGYGWYLGSSNNIAYDVESDVFGGAYRKYYWPEITGKVGGYACHDGESFDLDVILPESSEPYAIPPRGRYPHSIAENGYIFSFYSDCWNGLDGSNPVMSVYSVMEEEWNHWQEIASDNGAPPRRAWMPHGDVTYDPISGNYYALTTWQTHGLNGFDARSECIVVGSSEEPFEGEWSWSPFDELNFDVADYDDIVEMSGFKACWGTGGFGVVYCLIKGVEGNQKLSYLVTHDFGENWSTSGNPGNPFFTVDGSELFSWFGQSSTTSTSRTVIIDDPYIEWNLDGVVTENNTVHILARVNPASSETDDLYFSTDESGPVYGYYDLVGEIGSDGSIGWEVHFIANWVGVWSAEGAEVSQNHYTLSLGCLGGEVIYASWLDRAEQNPVPSPYSVDMGEIGNVRFLDDAYFTFSTDNGKSWSCLHNEEVQVDDNIQYQLKYAQNITNTPDQHEEGWTVSTKGKVNGFGFTVYAASQYCDDEVQFDPPYDFYNHVQNLYAWTIDYQNDGIIEAEQVVAVKDYKLSQNYPNPFNPVTTISYELNSMEDVSVIVYNAKGEQVWETGSRKQEAGKYLVQFDGTMFNSGIYFYALKINGVVKEKRKMVLIK